MTRAAPLFRSREEAGRLLADRLETLRDRQPVVLALPRGGVPVALEVALRLGAPMDLLLVRKIGVPWHPELAAGAVVDGRDPQTVLNEEVVRNCAVSADYLAAEGRRQLDEIERRRRLYLGSRAPITVAGRTAIVVDDGIATGATARAALRGLRGAGADRLVLATPVAPAETADRLCSDADQVVTLATPGDFGALSLFYEDFHQLDDDEVIALMARAPPDQRS